MRLSVLACASLALSAPSFAYQVSWTTLGTGSAVDMSDDGQFVAGNEGGNAFLWSSGGSQVNIGADDAVAVSNDGTVVFGNLTNGGGNSVAARWTSGTGWVDLGGLGGMSGTSVSTAYGMSGDGNVGTGLGWINAGTAGAFNWTPGGMTQLPQSGPNSSRGNAVSDDGTFIGGWDEAANGARRAVIWDGALAQTFVAISGTNPDGAGEVFGFSRNNTFVVGTTQGEGFVWDATDGLTKTGALPTTDPFALGGAFSASDDGTRVVGWYRVSFPFGNRATIWTPAGGLEELKVVLEANGAVGVPNLTFAFAISADGNRVLATDGFVWGIADLSGLDDFGTAYCFCDAGAPCGNLGAADEGCANSAGAGAILTASGSASAAADDLVLHCSQIPPNRPALAFAGTIQVNGGAGFLFGDGLRCAGGAVQRLGVQISDGSGVSTHGPGLGAMGGWSSGDTRDFQIWYRDPFGPCNGDFNLSHGLEIQILP